MAIRFSLLLLLLITSLTGFSQPGGGGGNRGGGGMNNGRFYGKVIDQKTGKPVEYATVTLFQNRFDSAAGMMKRKLITGQLTESNGDFSLENLPVRGEFIMRVMAIGYDSLVQKVKFTMPANMQDRQALMAALDKDLGNIALTANVKQLKEVVIDGSAPAVELKPDRRVYNMEKTDIAAGGTAEEALKIIPSVTVDLDGNVTLRNESPQIFIDGRPTTLTLNQIPADAIQSIEVITSPSAKYDASGGGAGIINIVLKKSRRTGYNGSVRAGVDQRGKINAGGDINVRQGKINVFLSGNVNQRRSISHGETERLNLFETPQTDVAQINDGRNDNLFAHSRAGIDYFMDNRNTFTFAGSYMTGRFKSLDEQTASTDTLYNLVSSSRFDRNTNSSRMFQNIGGTVSYKRLFTKSGKELTADVNYNEVKSDNTSLTNTIYFDTNQDIANRSALQKQLGGGGTRFITSQVDFVNPINEKSKIEAGARLAIRSFDSKAEVYIYDLDNGEYVDYTNPYSQYSYTDNVYAAYGTFSRAVNDKFNYQLGLRAESSDYNGKLTATGQTFRNLYPASLFPSGFLSYKPNDKNDFQLNASRRINRPNFFQLMPFTDYSDSLNLSRGNPSLKPEFSYKAEFTWMHYFNKENNVLLSMYYRNTQGIITRYQLTEYDSTLFRDALINTYQNANSSYMYGGEISTTLAPKKWIDLTPSISAYYAGIDGSNISANLTNEQFTWSAKMFLTIRLPKNFTFQANGDYRSQTAVVTGGGGGYGGGGMGMGMGGNSSTSVQGYNIANYSADMSLKYAFLKNKAASITLSVSDVFKTQMSGTHNESIYFIQDTWRIRDQRFFRLNFSYRFGKFDAALFKRKNNRSEGVDVM